MKQENQLNSLFLWLIIQSLVAFQDSVRQHPSILPEFPFKRSSTKCVVLLFSIIHVVHFIIIMVKRWFFLRNSSSNSRSFNFFLSLSLFGSSSKELNRRREEMIDAGSLLQFGLATPDDNLKCYTDVMFVLLESERLQLRLTRKPQGMNAVEICTACEIPSPQPPNESVGNGSQLTHSAERQGLCNAGLSRIDSLVH